MTGWHLDAVLRLRSDAEERAAVSHARAAATLRAIEAAASVAADAWRAFAGQRDGSITSIASLRDAHAHRRALEQRALTERERVVVARREEASAREAHAAAYRERRTLELLREREQERRRRARDAAEDDDLADAACARRPVRR